MRSVRNVGDGDAAHEDFGEGLRHGAGREPAARLEPQVRVVVHAEPGVRRQPGVDVTELAGLDSGAEHRLHPPLVRPASDAELRGPGTGQSGELVQEHPDVVRVAVNHIEQLVAEHGQLLRRPSARRGHPVGAEHDLVHHAVVDGREQLLLGTDVVVERALAKVIGRAELRDPGRVVAPPGEDAGRGVDDRFPSELPLRAATGVPVRLCGHEGDASCTERGVRVLLTLS